jgi:hypothetical protein
MAKKRKTKKTTRKKLYKKRKPSEMKDMGYKRRIPRCPLDSDFITQCCILWMNGVKDKAICYSLGHNWRDFVKWCNDPDPIPEDISLDLWGEKQIIKANTLTFGALRTRMRYVFEPVYETKMKSLIKRAEDDGDYRTATNSLKWLMERLMPEKFGKTAALGIMQIPVKVVTPDDLDSDDL